MNDTAILTELDEHGILTVTLNRPQSKNAFDTSMQNRMREVFYDAARDPAVRVLVLTGAGDAFCTGADVRSMGAADPADPIARKWAEDPVWNDLEAKVDRLKTASQASLLLHKMGKPTIARIRGAVAGAGLSLALACDFRFAAENAFFVTSFAKIGMAGDFGGTYFLTQLIGPSRAKELYMLSERVGAQQALQLGMVNRVVPEDTLEADTAAFAQRLAKGPPIALRYIKENVQAALDEPIEAAFDIETRNNIRCRLTEDCKEAMAAFKEKRDPKFTGR
jgi:2-(1,2-epoxy-1,2-dihydrophenyl)acetyl-CoA isomerase